MIVYRFELQNDRREREIVDACGYSKYEMWHDLAEKVASLDRQAEIDTVKIEFVDDISEEESNA